MLETPLAASVMTWFPFVLTAADRRHISIQRILEAIVIAAGSAAITTYITVQKMEAKMDTTAREIHEMKQAINSAMGMMERRRDFRDKQYDDLKAEIARIKVEMAKRR